MITSGISTRGSSSSSSSSSIRRGIRFSIGNITMFFLASILILLSSLLHTAATTIDITTSSTTDSTETSSAPPKNIFQQEKKASDKLESNLTQPTPLFDSDMVANDLNYYFYPKEVDNGFKQGLYGRYYSDNWNITQEDANLELVKLLSVIIARGICPHAGVIIDRYFTVDRSCVGFMECTESFFNTKVGQDIAASNEVIEYSSSILVDAALVVFIFIAPGIYSIYYNCLPFLDMNSHWSNIIAITVRIMIYLGADLIFWLELALIIMTPRQASIAINIFMLRFGFAMTWWALFWYLLSLIIPFSWYYGMYIILVCLQFFYNCIGLPYNVRQGFIFILYKDSHESKVIIDTERKKMLSYLESLDNDKIFDEFDESLDKLYSLGREVLGKGSFGEVFKGHVVSHNIENGPIGLGEEVAIKRLTVKESQGSVAAATNLLIGALHQDTSFARHYFDEILMEINLKERAYLTNVKHEIRTLKAINTLKHPSLISFKSAHLLNNNSQLASSSTASSSLSPSRSSAAPSSFAYRLEGSSKSRAGGFSQYALIVCSLVVPICVNSNAIRASKGGRDSQSPVAVASNVSSRSNNNSNSNSNRSGFSNSSSSSSNRSSSATSNDREIYLSQLKGPLADATVESKLSVIQTFFSGLAALHSAGIVHRDVKIENLAVHRHHKDVACVIDVGTAMLPFGKDSFYKAGTPIYHAPERITFKFNGKEKVGVTPNIKDAIYALGAGLVNGWSADVWSAALTAVEILTDVPPLALDMAERYSRTGSVVIHAYMIYYINSEGLSFESIGEDFKYHNKLAFQTWINALNSWSKPNVDILFQHFHKAMKGSANIATIIDDSIGDKHWAFKQKKIPREILSLLERMLAKDLFSRTPMDVARQCRYFRENRIGEFGPEYQNCIRLLQRSQSAIDRELSSCHLNSSSTSSSSSSSSSNKYKQVDTIPPPSRSISFEESISQTAKSSLGSTGVASRRFILLRDVMDAMRSKMSSQDSATGTEAAERRKRKAAGALINVYAIIDAFNRVAVPSPSKSRFNSNSNSSSNSTGYINSNSGSSSYLTSSNSKDRRSASISRSKSSASSSPVSPSTTPFSSNSGSGAYHRHNRREHHQLGLEIDRSGLETIFQSTGLSAIVGIKSSDLFDFFDADQSGTVDRMELLAGLSIVLSEFADIRTRATLLYHAFDVNLDGVLSISEFSSLMDAYGIPHHYKKDILVKLFDSQNAATLESFIKVVVENNKFRNQLLAVT